MSKGVLVRIGADALERLIDFAKQMGWVHFTLVADERTQAVLGGILQDRLIGVGMKVTPAFWPAPKS